MAEFDVTVTRSRVTRETFMLTVRDGEPGPSTLELIEAGKAGKFDDEVWEREVLHEVVDPEAIVPADFDEGGESVED